VTSSRRTRFGRYGRHNARLVLSVSVLLGATIAAACASRFREHIFTGPLALGTWGGDSAGMIVSDTAMHLHVACTYGDVSGRIPVDASGTF